MKIAILGFADQGKSAYRHWNKPGNELTICDQDKNLQVPAGAKAQLGSDYLKNLGQFDLLVRTPSLHPRDIAAANSPEILSKVTTNTNEFFKVCPSKNIIGVTGTKGKGTTSSLIAKMLENSGKKVHLGGNIGTPPLELLENNIQPTDYIVLELANYQLIDLKHSPHIAVCLMVVPEHMDWHSDMDEYITAKQQLFKWQKPEDFAIYFAKSPNSQKVAAVSPGQKISYMQPPGAEVKDKQIMIGGQQICSVYDLKLLGEHNWQNVCAALTAVWQIIQDKNAIKQTLVNFNGLPHRIEFVRKVDGVDYYDDSYGTTRETAIVALQAFDRPKVVILGGSDKGAEYDELAKTVKNSNVRKVVLIGDTAGRIKAALDRVNYRETVEGGHSMPEIVASARTTARPGDIVLLSTGCASFGMFANYEDRGAQFKDAVRALA